MPRPSLLQAATTRMGELLSSRDREVRWLVGLALVLAASGLVHAGVWSAVGWPSLEGPVSWRKPIVFGLSSGVTTLAVAWLVSLLGPTPGRRWLTWTYLLTMASEIALIDVQCWRGVASHYNQATVSGVVIFALMGVLIVTSVTAVGLLGARVARSREVALDTRLAAGGGVAMLLVGSVVGAVMASVGSAHHATGGGVLKVPHAVALHAIQVLPVLAWWLAQRGVSTGARARLVIGAIGAHALLFVAAVAGAVYAMVVA